MSWLGPMLVERLGAAACASPSDGTGGGCSVGDEAAKRAGPWLTHAYDAIDSAIAQTGAIQVALMVVVPALFPALLLVSRGLRVGGLAGARWNPWISPPGSGQRRLWVAIVATAVLWPSLKAAWRAFRRELFQRYADQSASWQWPVEAEPGAAPAPAEAAESQGGEAEAEEVRQETPAKALSSRERGDPDAPGELVTQEDLRAFHSAVTGTDGLGAWEPFMEKQCGGGLVRYKCWRRWRGVVTQYLSSTTIENVSPAVVTAFFLDDHARASWDDMLQHHEKLAGPGGIESEIFRWERCFPFFCSDRDYVFARRVFRDGPAEGDTTVTITKGVTHPSAPESDRIKRVTDYGSSWRCAAVPSQHGHRWCTETVLLHHEDMHIQKDVARYAVRLGMWNVVKKMQPGLVVYVKERYQAYLMRQAMQAPGLEGAASPAASSRLFIMDGSRPSAGTPEVLQAHVENALPAYKPGKRERLKDALRRASHTALVVAGTAVATIKINK